LKNEKRDIKQEELKQKIAGIINTRIADCRDHFNKPHKLRQSLKEIYYWIMIVPGVFTSSCRV
jgi:hypothetical protein